MADYIIRDAAKAKKIYSVERRELVVPVAEIDWIPPADVVARDCYDRILAENDTMREMLARTGKKCGDSMDDVRPVVFCKDCRHRDPEDHKCDSGETERQGCPLPVHDDYFCAYGER